MAQIEWFLTLFRYLTNTCFRVYEWQINRATVLIQNIVPTFMSIQIDIVMYVFFACWAVSVSVWYHRVSQNAFVINSFIILFYKTNARAKNAQGDRKKYVLSSQFHTTYFILCHTVHFCCVQCVDIQQYKYKRINKCIEMIKAFCLILIGWTFLEQMFANERRGFIQIKLICEQTNHAMRSTVLHLTHQGLDIYCMIAMAVEISIRLAPYSIIQLQWNNLLVNYTCYSYIIRYII